MRRKDSCDIDVSLAAQRDGKACLPLVEVRNDCFRELVGHIL